MLTICISTAPTNFNTTVITLLGQRPGRDEENLVKASVFASNGVVKRQPLKNSFQDGKQASQIKDHVYKNW